MRAHAPLQPVHRRPRTARLARAVFVRKDLGCRHDSAKKENPRAPAQLGAQKMLAVNGYPTQTHCFEKENPGVLLCLCILSISDVREGHCLWGRLSVGIVCGGMSVPFIRNVSLIIVPIDHGNLLIYCAACCELKLSD